MKLFLLFAIINLCHEGFAQQATTEKSKSASEDVSEVTANIFKYPEFKQGTILRKDGSSNAEKLNYNRVLGQVLFVDRQGKPTALQSPETIDHIIIATDTFYIYNNNVFEKISHLPIVNLYKKETIVYIEKDKSNNGAAFPIITNDSKLPYSIDDDKQDKAINKSSLFKFITEYVLQDNQGAFYSASKKIFYDLFPGNKNEVKTYLRSHSVNVNNEKDLKELLEYLEGFSQH